MKQSNQAAKGAQETKQNAQTAKICQSGNCDQKMKPAEKSNQAANNNQAKKK